MKRIFLDTNIILDFLIREEYKENIRQMIKCSINVDFFISYLSVANAAYIMRKYPRNVVRENIALLLDIFNVIPNTVQQVQEAVKFDVPDFEDMLQYQAALSYSCEAIITRNQKDFPFSSLPVMTVEEYLSK